MNIKKYKFAFTLIELLVVITIIGILASIALPVFNSVKERGDQAKDLSNAKQIGLGLRLYASDNNGGFPTQTILSGSLTNANDAFLNIVPTYIQTQKIFFVANSKWSTGNNATEYTTSGTSVTALQQGQNAYAYVAGLSDSSNASYPLVADACSAAAGTVANNAFKYSASKGAYGGVWSGKKAVVVRTDDSATLEVVQQSDFMVHSNGANTDGSTLDIFTSGSTWLTGATVYNPQ